MSRRALLDVNILVALFNPDHVHHDTAHDWFADEQAFGWATCPLTENGLLRVLGNPAYGGVPMRITEVADRLRTFCRSEHHAFWRDDISLRDQAVFNLAVVHGYRQLTDVYLLGLAVKLGGRLVTFDRTIPLAAVRGASSDSLAVVSLL